jgi:hypothetical protein
VICKLVPAQQRTVRSIIPKLTDQEKEFVDSFQKARPRSSVPANRSNSQKPLPESTRPASASSQLRKESSIKTDSLPHRINDENNPLQTNKTDPLLKRQRLSIQGKGDLWPDFPDEPSGEATQQALRKTWSTLIQSSTVHTLLPSNGANSMENYIPGCDLMMKSISHSRAINDSSLIEQLDLILKWAACALASRDHTTALRTLLAVILALFERLHELEYKISDIEAAILLPYFLDRAGTVKTPFQDQFLKVLSFIPSHDIYSAKQYGSQICVKVLEKSPRSKSRLLAANQLEACVQSQALTAIGRNGLKVLSKALSVENIVENRVAYTSLFELIIAKLDGDIDKLISLCGSTLSENAQGLIRERCSKQNNRTMNTVPNQSSTRLQTPSRTSSARTSELTPRIETVKSSSSGTTLTSTRLSGISPKVHVSKSKLNNQESPKLSSSAAATDLLRKRLQRPTQKNSSSSLPPSQSNSSQVQAQSTLSKILVEMECMIQHEDRSSIENALLAKINSIVALISADPTSVDAQEYDHCVQSLAG